VVKFNKDFIAKDKLLEIKGKGFTRKRVGFIMEERAIARQTYQIYHKGNVIGAVTSGTYSPNLDRFIGMAYIEKEFSKTGTSIEIKIRDKFYQAQVSNFNFIKRRKKWAI
jgi:aminomethyltransferase